MRIFIKYIISGFITLSFSSQTITSQETVTDTINVNEVVVTGSKTQITRNQLPFSISIVDKQAINSSSESALLPVLSEQVPGIFVSERGITGFGVATGAAGQISMRGIGGSPNTQVLVLLNGNPQYMGLFGHPMADAYVASDVERIEIIRGPGSTMYGSNAMGGVINIITKDAKKDFYSLNSRVMYGSFNTQKYTLNGGFKKDKFAVYAGVNYDKTDGHRDSSDFEITNAYFRMNYAINEHFNSSIDFSAARFKATDPGPVDGFAGEAIDIKRGMGAFVLNNQFEKISGSLRLFYNLGEHKITDGFHSNDHNWGVVFYQSLKLLKNNTLTLGLDFKNLGGLAENTFAMNGEGIQFVDTAGFELAAYALVHQQLFPKLSVNAGFRLDYSSFSGSEPVPTAGLAWQASPTTTVKAMAAKGFRNPTIRELFMFAPANNTLKAERMMNYEVSVNKSFMKNKINAEVAVFSSEGDNFIQVVMAGGQPQYQNTGKFSNFGYELAVNTKPVNQFHLHVNYSYLNMETPVLAAPEHKFFVSGTYQYKKLSVNVSLQSIAGLYIQTGNEPITESYNLLNSKVSYNFKHLEIFLKVENIFDEEYQINYGYPMPGITFFGGLQFSIHK